MTSSRDVPSGVETSEWRFVCIEKSLVAVHVEVEILARDLLIRAVGAHIGNGLVDLRLERRVVLPQAHADAVIAHRKRLADERETCAARRLQKAVLRFHGAEQR